MNTAKFYVITHRDEDGQWWIECKNGTVMSVNERKSATQFTDEAIAEAIAEVIRARPSYFRVRVVPVMVRA